MTRRKTYGTFTRDGMRRVAFTPAEAVELRFNGWVEQADAPRATVRAPGAAPTSTPPKKATAGKDDGGKDDSGKNPTTTPGGK